MRGMPMGGPTRPNPPPNPTPNDIRLPTAQEILANDEQEKLFQDQKSEAQREIVRQHLPKMLKNIRDNMYALRGGYSCEPLIGITNISNLQYCKFLLEETFAKQEVDYLRVTIERDYHSGWDFLKVSIKKGSPLLLKKG